MPILVAIGVFILAFAIWSYGTGTDPSGVKIPPNPIGHFKLGERIIILGLPLSGKSTLAAKLTKDVPRLLFFDPFQDNDTIANVQKISMDELRENPKLLAKDKFRYAIQPGNETLVEDADEFISYARAAGNLVMVMDEVGDYKRELEQELSAVARNVRHQGIVPIFVSQFATDIPKNVRRAASSVYSFIQYHPHDLDALAEVYGEKYANTVSHLRKYRYALWNQENSDPSIPSENPENPESDNQSPQQSQSGEEET
jgi:hypothetical protein